MNPPADQPFEHHVDISTDGVYPVAQLSTRTSLSQNRIKHAMQCGAVWLTRGNVVQRLRRAKKPLRTGDTLHLYYSDRVLVGAAAHSLGHGYASLSSSRLGFTGSQNDLPQLRATNFSTWDGG